MIYFITAKDLQRIYPTISICTAYRKLRLIKDSLQIKKWGKLTLDDYCECEGIPQNRVKQLLGYL